MRHLGKSVYQCATWHVREQGCVRRDPGGCQDSNASGNNIQYSEISHNGKEYEKEYV